MEEMKNVGLTFQVDGDINFFSRAGKSLQCQRLLVGELISEGVNEDTSFGPRYLAVVANSPSLAEGHARRD